MTNAFVFPGQGSQTVGMGKDLAEAFPEARAVFDEVDDALGQKLSTLMFEGPEEALTLTENAQPALMAVSMAVMRVLEAKGFKLADSAQFVAGHSLGEYSALCAAGAFSLSDAARLLRTRGQAMQKAVPVGKGGMAALLGLELDQVREIAQACGVTAANDNAPGQVVISGAMAGVDKALELAKEKGAKRALKLPVSAPFHSPLMQPAAQVMAEALAAVTVHVPVVPVVANVRVAPLTDPDDIRRALVEQVTGSVRWRESVEFMKQQGVTNLVEAGAGKVLAGLAKRIDRDLTALSLNSPADIDSFLIGLTPQAD